MGSVMYRAVRNCESRFETALLSYNGTSYM